MKIVINALSARLGGGQTYLKNLLAHLPDNSDLDILIYAPGSLSLPNDRRIRRGSISWPTENPLLRSVWERLVLPRILAREGTDVLFCPGGVIISSVPAGCKTVTMFRNMIPFDSEALARIPFGLQKVRNFVLKRVMLRSMSGAHLTIFISDYARHVICELTSISNSITIPHGIGDTFRTHGQKLSRPSWLPTGDYLLYVSKFEEYKHQFEVASAFATLTPDLTHRYKLLFLGEINKFLSRKIINLAQRTGLENQILIAGPVAYSDLPAAYHHATVNIFASSCENCPNILLEALAAGRPVISSNVNPMPEIGGNDIAYFSPFDPKSIAQAMRQVLEEPERATRCGIAARKQSNKYDWKVTARKTWNEILALKTP